MDNQGSLLRRYHQGDAVHCTSLLLECSPEIGEALLAVTEGNLPRLAAVLDMLKYPLASFQTRGIQRHEYTDGEYGVVTELTPTSESL